jgi:hypothetical protein
MGLYFFKDGHRYEGMWAEGKRNGHGKMEYAEGDSYGGDWAGDKRSGVGVLRLGMLLVWVKWFMVFAASGDVFRGHWRNDKKDGAGTFYYHNSGKIYEGEWTEGVPRCGVSGLLQTVFIFR